MHKVYLVIFMSMMVSSCAIEPSTGNSLSLTSAKAFKLSPKSYRIMVGGNAFSRPQDIAERAEKEANKLCGVGKYTVKSNKQEKVDTFAMVGANGTIPMNISSESGDVVIICK